MDEPMNYALISSDGIVENVIWLCEANQNDFPNAICVTNRPVEIGDCFADGVFTRDGKPVLTEAEQAQQLTLSE